VSWELEVAYQGTLPAGADDPDPVPVGVTTVVRLAADSDRIEFVTTIDNAARDHRLRAVFPVGDEPGPVRAEGQFAVVRRQIGAVQPRTRWCEPPDPTQHAIGVVALGPAALLTRGLPEYEARAGERGSELCLTMLRCVGFISRASDEIATRPMGAGPRMPTPEGQCLGRHVLHYALRLDADGLHDVALLRASQDYRCPLLISPAPVTLAPPITLEGDVVFSCLKGAQDGHGLVLRVFNPGSQPAAARVIGPVSAQRLRLDETDGAPIDDGRLEVGPGEIATLRLT
jgi:alpha-mannosidase